MLHQRYQQTAVNGMSMNQQIVILVKDIRQNLVKSDELFAIDKVAQSVEIGQKIIQVATTLATILNEGINQILQSSQHSAETVAALTDLRTYFVSLPVLITRYVCSRDAALYQKLIISLTNVENSFQTTNTKPD